MKKSGSRSKRYGDDVAPESAVAIDSAPEVGSAAMPADSPASVGNLDRVSGRMLLGWAAIKSGSVYRSTSVDILIDDEIAGIVLASTQREDLNAAGIGSGAHAFEFELPARLDDGREHRLGARVRETGESLPNAIGPLRLVAPARLTRLALEGSVIVCEGIADTDADLRAVSLYEAGLLLTVSHLGGRQAGQFQARIPLPAEVCDGCVHAFVVRAGTDGAPLGQLAEVTPLFETPVGAILSSGGGPLRPSQHPLGRQRYDALGASLRALAAGGSSISQSAVGNLLAAHEAVVRGFDASPLDKRAFAPLYFALSDSPKVSIVIPVRDKFAVTYHGLAALILAPNRASFEVIVVDDASEDQTRDIEGLISGIKVIRNPKSLGFVRSCNKGAQAARGEYVVMLNNDTEAGSFWLDELLWVFEHFGDVGLAGPKFLYPNCKLQEAGGIVWGNGDPWNLGRNGNPEDPGYNYARQVDYISGACIMLPRALWNELGGFDEQFAPAYYEDTDLAFRVRQRGLKTVYAPFSQVVHFEGMSNGVSVESGTKRFQAVNRPKFFARWVSTFRNNGQSGRDVALAKDRNVYFRALVIDHGAPKHDQEAGGYAAIQEMRLLQSLGCKVTFAPANMAYLGRYTENLQRTGVECLYAPFALSVNEVIEKRGGEFDVVYITRYSVAAKVVDAIRKHAPRAKILFCNADLHFLREIRHAIAAKSAPLMQAALQTRDEELALMRKVDLVLSYNEAEHAVILSHNLESTHVAKCPWVVDVPPRVPPFEARRDIAFLGGFGHPPNREAVQFFIADVLPLLRRRLPEVRFVIYGSGIPEEFGEREDEGVVIGGWVEDLAEVFDSCRVFVAPLRSGAGIKGKVIGALAHGAPTVVSPIAHEGTGAVEGVDLLVADKPQQWVDAIVALYTDPARWAEVSAAARMTAGRRFSFEAGRRMMKAALEQAGVFVTDEHSALYPVR